MTSAGEFFTSASIAKGNTFKNIIGDKRYELSNHLGNVLSVISDRKVVNSNASTIKYLTDFSTTVSPWVASGNTQNMVIENGRLKVETGAHLNGTNGYYSLTANKTYNIKVNVDKSQFTPPLEFSIWKGNSKKHSEFVANNKHIETLFTPTITGTYRFNFRLRQVGYNSGVQPFYIDNFTIIDVTNSNNIVNLGLFKPDVLSHNDYYPFGMLVPNRHASVDSYRYGFQGQEKDDEVKGEGNSLNYKYRMHDPRVGRFFAKDPLTSKYPWYTPYSFSGNKVIAFGELEGLEEYHFMIKKDDETGRPKLEYIGSTPIYHRVKASSSDKLQFIKRTNRDDMGGGKGLIYWVAKDKKKVYTVHKPKVKEWGIGVFALWGNSSYDMWKGAKKTFSGSFSVEEKDIPSFITAFNSYKGKGQFTYKPPTKGILKQLQQMTDDFKTINDGLGLGQEIGEGINKLKESIDGVDELPITNNNKVKYQLQFFDKDNKSAGGGLGFSDIESAEKGKKETEEFYKNDTLVKTIKIEEIKR